MPQRSCPGCFGSGRYRTTQQVPNPGGGRLYREIAVWKLCFFCGGIGTIYSPEPYSPPGPHFSLTAESQTSKCTPPCQFEEGVASLAVFVTSTAIWYYGHRWTTLDWYWPETVGAVVDLLIGKLLTGPFRWILHSLFSFSGDVSPQLTRMLKPNSRGGYKRPRLFHWCEERLRVGGESGCDLETKGYFPTFN